MNCVAFGFIETRMTRPHSDPESRIVIEGETIQAGVPEQTAEAVKAIIPLGRAGTAEEAANGVYLLCSPESDYVSGQVLVVGGGISL